MFRRQQSKPASLQKLPTSAALMEVEQAWRQLATMMFRWPRPREGSRHSLEDRVLIVA
jgi:hypothetical protein